MVHQLKAKHVSWVAVKQRGFRNIVHFPIFSTKDSAFPTLTVGTEPGRIMN